MSLIQYLSILIGNGVLFWVYYTGEATFGDILWAFWGQSVIIGLANAIRMGALRQFSTEGLKSNGKPVDETPAGKWSTTVFFCFHYGFFHLIYSVFLGSEHGLDWATLQSWVTVGLAAFAVGEAFTLGKHLATDRDWKPNLGTLMFTPYLRIIPMHLTIIGGGFLAGFGQTGTSITLFVFLGLKSLADLGMQAVDDHMDRQRLAASQ